MHNLDLILTLAGGFTAALILGYLTQRAGLSPIALGLTETILERLGATAEQNRSRA